MKIVFFGTADFGIEALKAMLSKSFDVCAIVTNPPKPAGRGLHLRKSPVNIFADESNLVPVITPENLKDESFLQELRNLDADLFVVVAFSILPKEVFSIPKFGTYNIHAALLPKFRGPAPIQRAIESGAEETGVTVFKIDAGVDTGDIVLQKKAQILPEDNTPSLYKKLSILGAEALLEALREIKAGKVEYKIQNKSEATKAGLLKKEEARINWNLTASQINNKIRAFKPFPNTFFMLDNEPVIIEKANIGDESAEREAQIGEIVKICKDKISVQTGQGILEILELKPAGKRAMPTRDFLNGKQIKEGKILK